DDAADGADGEFRRLARVVGGDDRRRRLRLHVLEVFVRYAAPDADQVLSRVAVIRRDDDVIGAHRRAYRLDGLHDVERARLRAREVIRGERALVVLLDERDRLVAVVDDERARRRARAENAGRAPRRAEAEAAEVDLAVGRGDVDGRVQRALCRSNEEDA